MELSRTLRPNPPGPVMRFVTHTARDDTRYAVVGRQVWAHFIHWIGGRSSPCTRLSPTDPCELCGPDTPRRYAGYLHVCTEKPSKEIFLCIPPAAAYEFLAGQPDDYDIRGRYLWARRLGSARTSGLAIWLDPHVKVSYALPEEKNVGKYLRYVFGAGTPLTQAK